VNGSECSFLILNFAFVFTAQAVHQRFSGYRFTGLFLGLGFFDDDRERFGHDAVCAQLDLPDFLRISRGQK